MERDEIFEEIRALLREPQQNLVQTPWTYDDSDLIVQIRSALRRLRAIGIRTDAVMSKEGVLSPAPTERHGMLICYHVAFRLLSGDLVQKLNTGELGFLWRSGSDIFDTKTATIQFKDIASAYQSEFEALLAGEVASSVDEAASALGSQVVPE